jgi:hypothetical protein
LILVVLLPVVVLLLVAVLGLVAIDGLLLWWWGVCGCYSSCAVNDLVQFATVKPHPTALGQ